jgi:hypothetical protein
MYLIYLYENMLKPCKSWEREMRENDGGGGQSNQDTLHAYMENITTKPSHTTNIC